MLGSKSEKNQDRLADLHVLKFWCAVLALVTLATFLTLSWYFRAGDPVEETIITANNLDGQDGYDCQALSALSERSVEYACQSADAEPALQFCAVAKGYGARVFVADGDAVTRQSDTVTAVSLTYPKIFFETHADCQAAYAQRTCGVPVEPEYSNSRMAWTFETGSHVVSSPAVGADGSLYFGGRDTKFYALAADGTLRWSFATGSRVYTSPVLHDGVLYFCSYDHKIYAVDTNGVLQWTYETDWTVYASPTLGNNGTMLYVGGNTQRFYALHLNGSLAWIFHATPAWPFQSTAVVDDSAGTVYVGNQNNKVYALDMTTGAERWAFLTGNPVQSSPVLSADRSVVYVGSNDGSFYALNATNGQMIWCIFIGKVWLASPLVGPDGTVYIGTRGTAAVYALRGHDGAVLWRFDTDDAIESKAAFGLDGSLLITSTDGSLYALHPVDGRLLWTYATGGPIHSSPVVTADGRVLVGSNDGKLHAVLHTHTMHRVWQLATGGQVRGAVTFHAGLALVASRDSRVYAMDADTGIQRWSFTTGNSVMNSARPSADGSVVFVGSTDNKFYCLATQTGSVLWTFTGGGSDFLSAPTITPDGGLVLVGNADEHVYALHANTGTLAWKFRTGENVWSTPALRLDGQVMYVGSDNGLLYALATATGLLQFNVSSAVRASPLVLNSLQTVVVGSVDGVLYALDTTTGALRWSTTTVGAIVSAAAWDAAGDRLLVAAGPQALAVDADDGHIDWAYDMPADIVCSPAPDGAGHVLVASGSLIVQLTSGGQFHSAFYAPGLVFVSLSVGPRGLTYVGSNQGVVLALERQQAPADTRVCLVSTLAVQDNRGVSTLQARVDGGARVAVGPASNLSECQAAWRERYCSEDSSGFTQARDAFCAATVYNPPYLCTREVLRDWLETLSLSFGFAELVYIVLLFLVVRWLYFAHARPANNVRPLRHFYPDVFVNSSYLETP